MRQKGFKGSFPHFRRITKERIHLLTFQFDLSGGGFVIEIANCRPEGFTNSWGKEIAPNKVTAHDMDKRKRIQSNMNTPSSGTSGWFRYDRKVLFGLGNVYKRVCKDVLPRLDVAEAYWQEGELNG